MRGVIWTEKMTTVVAEFAVLVREYVALVDGANAGTACAFLRSCARVLARIYAIGLDLPDVSPTNEETDGSRCSPSAPEQERSAANEMIIDGIRHGAFVAR